MTDQTEPTVIVACSATTIATREEWAVVTAYRPDGTELTLSGYLADLPPARWAEFTATAIEHPIHGRQWQVRSWRRIIPEVARVGRRHTLAFLCMLRGMTPAAAAAAVQSGTVAALLHDQAPLDAHLPAAAVARVMADLRRYAAECEFDDLTGASAGSFRHRVLVQCDGDVRSGWSRLRDWSLADLPDLPFAQLDAVARAAGMAPDDPRRIRAAGGAVIADMVRRSRHTMIPLEDARQAIARRLGLDAMLLGDEWLRSPAVSRVGEFGVGTADLVAAERAIDRTIRSLLTRPPLSLSGAILTGVARARNLDPDKELALAALGRHPVLTLTGHAGSGKTTTIAAAVGALIAQRRRVLLCAQNGRAVTVLQEATGREVFTCHRTLGLIDSGDVPACDLAVVDECSLIDTDLMGRLLPALARVAQAILLVGDPGQLPPVGPGRPYLDILSCGAVPNVHLTEVHRFANGAAIPLVAHGIRYGEVPPDRAPGFILARLDRPDVVERRAVLETRQLVAEYSPHEVMALAPTYAGVGGIDALNGHLQYTLNPDAGGGAMDRLGVCWRPGDPVYATGNNYTTGRMLGMRGRIRGISGAGRWPDLDVTWDDGATLSHTMVGGRPQDLVHGYALSYHRSQGGGWDGVVVVLTSDHVHVRAPGEPPLMTREAIYTAVTRGRSEVRLLVERDALEVALSFEGSARRTALHHLLPGGGVDDA